MNMERNLKISTGILNGLIDSYDEEDRDSLARISSIIERIDSDYSIKTNNQEISDNVNRLNQVARLNLSSKFIPSMAFGEYGIYTNCRLDYLESVAFQFKIQINSMK